MSPRQRHLVFLGLRLAVIYAAVTFVLGQVQGRTFDAECGMFLFCAQALLALPVLLMSSDGQINWYRRVFFYPWAAVWPAALALFVTTNALPWLYGALLLYTLGTWTVVPVVWMVGALWIWRNDRHRRFLAR